MHILNVAILWAFITSFSMQEYVAQDEAFFKRVESRVRRIAAGDEGLADPVERKRLQQAMSEGGDWEDALLRMIDLGKYDQDVIGTAIGVLQLRGSFEKPAVQATVIKYFRARVKAAQAHPRSDPLFDPVVRLGIRGLTSRFARHGGLFLLAALEFAGSEDEQANPLLDEYTLADVAEAALEKANSSHLQQIRKLSAVTKNEGIKTKLERVITKVSVEAEAAGGRPAVNGETAKPDFPEKKQ